MLRYISKRLIALVVSFLLSLAAATSCLMGFALIVTVIIKRFSCLLLTCLLNCGVFFLLRSLIVSLQRRREGRDAAPGCRTQEPPGP